MSSSNRIGRISADRSPLFEINEEEPIKDGEVEPADHQGPGPTPECAGLNLKVKEMSMASIKFDVGNKVRLCRPAMNVLVSLSY